MLELTLRIGFSLLVVFALMWGIAKMIRRPLAGRGGDLMVVVSRQQLTRGSSVAIVRVGEQALILGVTDQQVTLLKETSLDELEAPKPVHRSPVEVTDLSLGAHAAPISPAPAPGALNGSALSPQTWATAVKFLRDRTVRR
ncbi:MAG: hypothetical protein JWO79_1672 [Actinomycetia bacterium]|nr:hypothetical protein [Actinomycetes bacterium]